MAYIHVCFGRWGWWRPWTPALWSSKTVPNNAPTCQCCFSEVPTPAPASNYSSPPSTALIRFSLSMRCRGFCLENSRRVRNFYIGVLRFELMIIDVVQASKQNCDDLLGWSLLLRCQVCLLCLSGGSLLLAGIGLERLLACCLLVWYSIVFDACCQNMFLMILRL